MPFNWSLATQLHKNIKCPVFLSGGLTENNVAEAIRAVHPEWIDASTSLEYAPGRKDHAKVKKFIEKAKGKK